MPRTRSIKPEIRRSLTVSSWPYPVRWTFVGLPGYLDDEGRGIDDVRLVKAELYPLDDDMTIRKIDAHLREIAASGPLCRYEVDGRRYLHVTTWAEHQKPNRPTPSRIPPCPVHEKSVTAHGALTDDSVSAHGADIEGSSLSRAPAEQGAGSKGTGIAPEEPAREPRQRDELFEAVVAACGIDANHLTESGRGSLNAALKQLRAVDAAPAQVTLRARNYRQQFGSAALTAQALAKHWASLNGAGSNSDSAPPWDRSS